MFRYLYHSSYLLSVWLVVAFWGGLMIVQFPALLVTAILLHVDELYSQVVSIPLLYFVPSFRLSVGISCLASV